MRMQCWEKGPTTSQMQRGLSYICINGSGRAMSSGKGCSSAEDDGQ